MVMDEPQLGRTAWTRTCRKGRVGDHRLHDLRHTFATRLRNLWVGYEGRQALLGHWMPGMTHNYSHGGAAWDAHLRKAVDLLDVDYRQSGLISGTVSRQKIQKNVIGLDAYKLWKEKEKSAKLNVSLSPCRWPHKDIPQRKGRILYNSRN